MEIELYLPRACGSSQSQHLSLLQSQGDLSQHGRHIEVGEKEPAVPVHVTIFLVFVLTPNLVKQFPNTLQKGNTNGKALSSEEIE